MEYLLCTVLTLYGERGEGEREEGERGGGPGWMVSSSVVVEMWQGAELSSVKCQ